MANSKQSMTWPALILLGASALASCASVPKLNVGADPKSTAHYAARDSLAAPEAAWPTDGWWRAYGDTQLDALIETALAGTPSLAQTQARFRKAEASSGETKSDLWPSLEVDGNVGEVKESLNQGFPPQFAQYLPRGYNSTGYLALKFDYEFDFWGKNREALAAAVF